MSQLAKQNLTLNKKSAPSQLWILIFSGTNYSVSSRGDTESWQCGSDVQASTANKCERVELIPWQHKLLSQILPLLRRNGWTTTEATTQRRALYGCWSKASNKPSRPWRKWSQHCQFSLTMLLATDRCLAIGHKCLRGTWTADVVINLVTVPLNQNNSTKTTSSFKEYL